jgi:hypothetical protein
MAQIFVNDVLFTKFCPMKKKSDVSETLQTFIHKIGIPHSIHSDFAKEIMQGQFKTLGSDYSIPCTLTEPYSPWQNHVEGGIRELKRHVNRKMKSHNIPKRL